MKRVAASVLLFAASFAAPAAAQSIPALTGQVVDTADILDATVEADLASLLSAHEQSTGNQIVVLTIPSLNGAVLEEYATLVFRTWGIGDADRDNGVLILIARDDREIRIEVGYGLEGALTDGTAGTIIRQEMTPRFRDGDFGGGTRAAALAVVETLEGTYVASAHSDEEAQPSWLFSLFMACAFGWPLFLTFVLLEQPPAFRYTTLACTAPFVAIAAGIIGKEFIGTTYIVAALFGFLLYIAVYAVTDLVVSRSPAWQARRAKARKLAAAFKTARRSGRTSVVVDGQTYSVPTQSSGGSSGGYSGGGGSSGGGGASGGW